MEEEPASAIVVAEEQPLEQQQPRPPQPQPQQPQQPPQCCSRSRRSRSCSLRRDSELDMVDDPEAVTASARHGRSSYIADSA